MGPDTSPWERSATVLVPSYQILGHHRAFDTDFKAPGEPIGH